MSNQGVMIDPAIIEAQKVVDERKRAQNQAATIKATTDPTLAPVVAWAFQNTPTLPSAGQPKNYFLKEDPGLVEAQKISDQRLRAFQSLNDYFWNDAEGTDYMTYGASVYVPPEARAVSAERAKKQHRQRGEDLKRDIDTITSDIHSLTEQVPLAMSYGQINGMSAEDLQTEILNKQEELKKKQEELDSFAAYDANVGLWATDNFMSGLAGFNESVTSVLDMGADFVDALIGENPITKPVHKLDEHYENVKEGLSQRAAAQNTAIGGPIGKYGGMLIQGVAGAIPNALLAIATAGTSQAATTASLTSNALVQVGGGGMGTRLVTAVSSMARKPQFWSSFAQGTGNGYDEAIKNGATFDQAATFAIITGLLNGGIEMSGVEALPDELLKGDRSAFWNWFKSMYEEGKEEVLQGLVSELTAKYTYDSDKNPISWTDPKAVVSGRRAADEFIGGSSVAALIGGGEVALDNFLGQISSSNTETVPDNYLSDWYGTDVKYHTNSVQSRPGANTGQAYNTSIPVNTVTDSNGLNTNPAERAVNSEYASAVNDELLDFILEAKYTQTNTGAQSLGSISDKAAADIKQVTGINTAGFETIIDQSVVEKALLKNGSGGTIDETMSIADIARMPYVIDQYDTIAIVRPTNPNVTGPTSLSSLSNSAQLGDSLIFEKKVNGTYYVVEAVPDVNTGTINVQSAYLSETSVANNAQKLAKESGQGYNGNGLAASTEGAGKTTLADWDNNTNELAKTSPVEIPENATIKSGTKAAGYDQISYKWTDSGYNYEARWHTKTPGAPAGQGNTWVITKVTPGTSTGNARTVHILAGDKWVTRYEWQAAINAYQNGTMTAAQEAMLKAGHWLAP